MKALLKSPGFVTISTTNLYVFDVLPSVTNICVCLNTITITDVESQGEGLAQESWICHHLYYKHLYVFDVLQSMLKTFVCV